VAIGRDQLVAYLDRFLAADAGRDYGPNGLQVQGKEEIGKLVTGVSAGRELFERAARAGADAVLVHHGIFWDFTSPLLVGFHYERVAALLNHDLNLLAYHLPLDRHPEVGNNALACRALGLEELEPFGIHEGLPVGFRGRFATPVPSAELVARCARVFAQEPLAFGGGPPTVTTVGMVSGGAQRELYQAIAAGLDAYVTGEASEWVMNVAREAGIHYLACGHYATERLGVRALGEHLAEKFSIEVEFIDLPNPV
jgi:dinuclear metal center YbgI/SA1388 family protein